MSQTSDPSLNSSTVSLVRRRQITFVETPFYWTLQVKKKKVYFLVFSTFSNSPNTRHVNPLVRSDAKNTVHYLIKRRYVIKLSLEYQTNLSK